MIPEIPEIAPFVPADTEVFHKNSFFCQHFAYFSACHAGHGITVDDNLLFGVSFDSFLE